MTARPESPYKAAADTPKMASAIWYDPENDFWEYDVTYPDGSIAATESGFETHAEANRALRAILKRLTRENM